MENTGKSNFKTWIWVAVVLIIVAIASSNNSNNSATPIKNGSTSAANIASNNQTVPDPGTEIANYLQAVINYAHEGYLADSESKNQSSSDVPGMMSSIMEAISDENQAISAIATFESSSNKTISQAASLLALSENDVMTKQQAALDKLRQLSNGTIPDDISYSAAELQAAMKKRNDTIILAMTEIPYLTMDTSSITGSSTATVGPLNPTGMLNDEQRSSLKVALQMDFGSALDSNENDIFLIMAQELNTLLNSQTYSEFHDVWRTKASLIN